LKRTFITNLAFLLFLNLLIKPFWMFGIDRSVQNAVGAADYGLYFALFNLSLIFNILLDIGITTFNNREIAQYHHLVKKYVSRILGLKFLLAVVYALVCIIAGLLIGYTGKEFRLLYVLIFNQFLASMLLYLRSNISGLQYFKTDSALSVLDRLLMIIICSFLLWGHVTANPFRIEWFIYAQTVSYSIAALTALLIVMLKAGRIRFRFSRVFSLMILKKSYPYAVLILLMGLYNRVGPVILERMLGSEGDVEAGIYAQAFRLLDAFSMYGFLISGLLLPMFARMLKLGQYIESFLRFAFLVVFIPSLLLTVGCVAYRSELMTLLYYSHIEVSARVFTYLMIGFLGISSSYVFGTLLTANGSLKELNIMALITVVLTLVLNVALIPLFRSEGAAAASMISQLFAALVQAILVFRIFHLQINYRLFGSLLVYTIILVLLAGFSLSFHVTWYVRLLLFLSAGFLVSFPLGLFSVKDMVKTLRMEE